MADFDIDGFVAQLRRAARGDAPATRALMVAAFSNPAAIAAGMSGYTGDEEILFEDASVSIWYCRFQPGVLVPPHDHQTSVTIGVYQGTEVNRFYVREGGRLVRKSTRRLAAGDVVSLGPEAIHSVQADGKRPSCAIHVYLAALSTIERSLFDWDTGEAYPFTDENYDRLLRQFAPDAGP